MPSPPVALVGGDAGLAASLRAALTALDGSDEGREALALGAVRRFDAVGDADYAPVRAADATR
jgi:ABC-type phosphate/phosphonate transport system substrate-binding protein